MSSWETFWDASRDAARAEEPANEGSLRRELRKNPEQVLGTFRLTKETFRPARPADAAKTRPGREARSALLAAEG